jgi:hypothetical protein
MVLEGGCGWVCEQELLSASYDDTVKVWCESPDEDEFVCAGSLVGHQSTVWTAAYHPTHFGRFGMCHCVDHTASVFKRTRSCVEMMMILPLCWSSFMQ